MNELAALVRFVHLAAAIALAGGFGFRLLVAPATFAGPTPLRRFRWCVGVIFATLLLGLWLQAANVGGSLSTDFPTLTMLLTETQFGKVWMARMALLFGIAALVQWWPSNLALGFALSAAFLAALAFAGHAAAADGTALILQLSADALHLLVSGLWLGGLIPLASLLRECNRMVDAEHFALAQGVTRRFSNLALASVILLIATGSYNAWNLVGGFAPLFGTPYGHLLLFKLGLLVPLLIIGAKNLLRLKPTILAAKDRGEEAATALRTLSRNIAVEIFLGIVILLIVGHMGVTPPARHVRPDWPLSFRWDWSVLEKAPKAFAEVQRAAVWIAIGGIAVLTAIFRGRRRLLVTLIGMGTLSYGINIVHQAVMIDAYPDTYKRPPSPTKQFL